VCICRANMRACEIHDLYAYIVSVSMYVICMHAYKSMHIFMFEQACCCTHTCRVYCRQCSSRNMCCVVRSYMHTHTHTHTHIYIKHIFAFADFTYAFTYPMKDRRHHCNSNSNGSSNSSSSNRQRPGLCCRRPAVSAQLVSSMDWAPILVEMLRRPTAVSARWQGDLTRLSPYPYPRLRVSTSEAA